MDRNNKKIINLTPIKGHVEGTQQNHYMLLLLNKKDK